MIQKFIKQLYKIGLISPYQAIDSLRYLKRLNKSPIKAYPYVSDKDQAQYSSSDDILIRSQSGDVSALFLCNPRSHIDRQIIKQGVFSGAVFKTLISHISEKSTIVDIGANVGTISVATSLLYPDVDIHAFEPNPYALKRLRYNQSLNNISNLIIHEKALGSKPEFLAFHHYDDHSGDIGLSSFITPTQSMHNADIKPVEIITLDSCLNEFIKPVSIIKIDVQGFELEVLEGSEQLITKYRPVIILEHEDNNLASEEDARLSKQSLKAYFNTHEYEVFYITRYDYNMLLPVKWDRPLNGDLLALPLELPQKVS